MPITRHLVMVGNPGTGKKTVAHLLGRLYHGYGVLDTGPHGRGVTRRLHCRVRGHDGAAYRRSGEECARRRAVLHEAYMLEPRVAADFGQEAIDALIASMEKHRNDLCVVMAGYAQPMQQFLQAQPGLRGRFGMTLVFPDYTDDELLEVLRRFCEAGEYLLSEGAEQRCRTTIAEVRGLLGAQFDNARTVRRLFERAVLRQSARLQEGARSSACSPMTS